MVSGEKLPSPAVSGGVTGWRHLGCFRVESKTEVLGMSS